MITILSKYRQHFGGGGGEWGLWGTGPFLIFYAITCKMTQDWNVPSYLSGATL